VMLVLLSLALADAVNAEPENCPSGSDGVSSHSGEWCAPTTCRSDDECNELPCSPDVGLCIETTEDVPCGGGWIDTAEPCTFTKEEVFDKCDSDSDCDDGVPCVIADRCARPGLDARCGCSASPHSWLAGVAGLFVLLLARMR